MFGVFYFAESYFADAETAPNIPNLVPTMTMIPRVTIRPQVLTQTILDGASTALFDDPVSIYDDPHILFGSETTPVPDIRVNTRSNAPKATTRIRR